MAYDLLQIVIKPSFLIILVAHPHITHSRMFRICAFIDRVRVILFPEMLSLFFFFGPLLCLENLKSSFYMDSSVTFLLVHWSSLTTAPTPVPQLSKL